mmetsp:Transcript_18272/g.29016  ORF Transcript_18272/g.29016 Transcript_18272/m.29016 type:complete len:314 (-) Transcript_18272:3179-4120(-)
MRLGAALDLGRILAGLGQGAGVITPLHAVANGIGDTHRNGSFVQTDGAFQAVQLGQKIIRRMAGHIRPQMIAHFIQLGVRHKQINGPACVQNGKALGNRVARNVSTANVQQPAQAVRQGNHRRLGPGSGQRRAQPGPLVAMAFACKLKGVHFGRLRSRARLIRPDPIHQIAHLHQLDRRASQCIPGLRNLSRRMQPRVKPNTAPLGQLLFQPPRQGHLRPRHRGIDIGHLRLDLCAIAAIDEHARNIRQNRAKPRRPGKAGKPRQPLIAGRHIFTLMGICTGHQKSIQPLSRNLITQCRQPRRPLLRPGRHFK